MSFRRTQTLSKEVRSRDESVEVPTTDAAIILSVTAVLVALIILFLFQTPGLGLGIFGE